MIKKLGATVLLALLLWGAYVSYTLLNPHPKLSARWGTVTEANTELIIEGEWNRPPLLPVSVEDVAIGFVGVPIARAKRVELSGENVLIALSIDNRNLISALFKYLEDGQNGTFEISLGGKALKVIPLKFSVTRNVHVDILKQFNFTSESKPVLGGLAYTPTLLETNVTWMGEQDGRGTFIADMRLYNPNSFPIPLANLTFDIYVNEIKVGTGYLLKPTTIPAKEYTTVRTTIELDKNELARAWALHVKNGEKSTVEVQIGVSVNLLGKNLKIPLKTEKRYLETHVIEDINGALAGLTQG